MKKYDRKCGLYGAPVIFRSLTPKMVRSLFTTKVNLNAAVMGIQDAFFIWTVSQVTHTG